MGNEKGNSYWEKELPPNFDRSGTEEFILAKYEGKLWVAKNAKQPVPLLILICEGARAFPQTTLSYLINSGTIEVPHPLLSLNHEVAVIISQKACDVPQSTTMDYVAGKVMHLLWI